MASDVNGGFGSFMSKNNQDYSVLVIGETCEDRFIYGYIERISPEQFVPIFKTDVKPFIITNPVMLEM